MSGFYYIAERIDVRCYQAPMQRTLINMVRYWGIYLRGTAFKKCKLGNSSIVVRNSITDD
jgi:hypothetical protein